MNVLLVGPRGCGKTTVGRLLAERTGLQFVDLDERTLARLGADSVHSAWASQGESQWRKAEYEALLQTLGNVDQIIALGGGTPMIPTARATIENARKSGEVRTIYLKCPEELLVARLQSDPGDRPSLTGHDVAAETRAVLAQREPTYLALADFVCDASRPPAEIVAELLEKIAV